MNDVYVDVLNQALTLHKQGKFDEAELLYNRVLNRKPFDEGILFLLSDLYLRKDYNALAINLLLNLLQNNPRHGAAWCNLGIGFRKENDYSSAKGAWMKAIAEGGETVEVCSNLATLYADRAEPDKAIEWCDKALKLDPANTSAKWQKALAVLTLKRWEEGWELYKNRQYLDTWDSRKTIDVPLWDGSKVDHLYVHGEQGVGDEVMFCSALKHLLYLKKITVEVNEKLVSLVKQSFPTFNVVAVETSGDYDAKIPIGSLSGMFKPDGECYLMVDYDRVRHYRTELEKLGPGPYIALTWMGGAKATRVEDRSIRLEELRPIMDKYTCVSAQYGHTNPMIETERVKAGLHKINDECTGADLSEQAALFAAVDAVVTVQQTAVHVAGAVGAKTYAMIGSHPHWRYGVEGDSLPWYKSVKLFRQKKEWSEVISSVLTTINNDFKK